MNSYWPLRLDHVHPYAFWREVFSPEDCKKISDIGSSTDLEEGKTTGVSNIRKSSITWIYPHETTFWIFTRLVAVVNKTNEEFFKFDVSGLAESLQYTRYVAPDGRYGRHVDRQFNILTRKLSVSVQLSDPATYQGGDLLLHTDDPPVSLPREQGTVIVFPSYSLHEVTPVTQGVRESLVCWVNGEPFR